jgi:hypothetical protein
MTVNHTRQRFVTRLDARSHALLFFHFLSLAKSLGRKLASDGN